MADIGSLAATLSYPAPAAAAAPAQAIADFATPPPPAALAAGGTVLATVLASDAGAALLLKTDFGTLALNSPLVLAAGTSVELKLFAGPPASAAILSVDGAPVGSAAPRNAAEPQSPSEAATPPSESVELGQAVRATVLAPGTATDAPAAGTSLTIRVLPAPTSTAMAATILQSGGGATVVATPMGKLALEAQIEAAPGALLSLERVDTPAAAAAQSGTRSAASPSIGADWPALDEALQSLDKTAPALAAALRADLTPTAAPRLTATLMFFMGVLRGSTAWPGDQMAAALGAAGRGDLRARLAKDLDDLRTQARESLRGDWRIFTLPLLDEGAVRPIRLYLRNRDEGSAAQSEQATRFVLDLDLSRLGP
ncbi:MAG TPA: hypothetical protein VEC75_06315, partial [Stellaceae bacterium]|nr:hypothetical protein [Stellaceae bacterium]